MRDVKNDGFTHSQASYCYGVKHQRVALGDSAYQNFQV
ncbi:hypothetical protein PMI22_01983 [Pseudomonas sp. GM21]|nr:hypothetical protein PMI22_01983 [Pseudomonas sp. GM21]